MQILKQKWLFKISFSSSTPTLSSRSCPIGFSCLPLFKIDNPNQWKRIYPWLVYFEFNKSVTNLGKLRLKLVAVYSWFTQHLHIGILKQHRNKNIYMPAQNKLWRYLIKTAANDVHAGPKAGGGHTFRRFLDRKTNISKTDWGERSALGHPTNSIIHGAIHDTTGHPQRPGKF